MAARELDQLSQPPPRIGAPVALGKRRTGDQRSVQHSRSRGAMKHYKMQLSVRLIEVAEFDSPTEEAPPCALAPVAAGIDSVDPVKKQDAIVAKSLEMMERLVRNAEKTPFSSGPQIAESEISFTKTYDVPAQSIEDAAAKLKVFETAAAGIGIPSRSAVAFPVRAYPVFGG